MIPPAFKAISICQLLIMAGTAASWAADREPALRTNAAAAQTPVKPLVSAPGLPKSEKDYFVFDFPPGFTVAEVIFPVKVLDRRGHPAWRIDRVLARGRFKLPKSIDLQIFLRVDAINNMQYIEQFKVCQVRQMDASDLDFEDSHLERLKDFHGLYNLNLYGTLVTDRSLPTIGKFAGLTMLRLSHTSVNGEGFKYLSNLRNMQSLSLSNIALKKGTVSQLKPICAKLTNLDLGRTELSKEDASVLRFLPNIELLDISCNSKIDNSCSKLLQSLNKLRRLNIEDTGITDKSLAILTKLPKLETVYVRPQFFWQGGKPSGKLGHVKILDVSSHSDTPIETLSPLH